MIFLKLLISRLFGQALGCFQRIPLPVVLFTAGLVVGAGGVGYAWFKQPSCKEKAAIAALELERAARYKAEDLINERNQTIEILRSSIASLRSQVIQVLPDDNRECDFPPDAAELLNRARSR